MCTSAGGFRLSVQQLPEADWRVKGLQLNVYIASASDGFYTAKAVQMPELSAHARTLEEIPEAVRSAAAAVTGQPANFFDVVIDF
jgi:hypothetical protein